LRPMTAVPDVCDGDGDGDGGGACTQWLPPFSRLEKVQMRALCYALHVVHVAAGVPWYAALTPPPATYCHSGP